MPLILQWPVDFVDPTPATGLDPALVEFFDQMIAAGATVHAVGDWSLFGLSRGARRIDFIRRGRSAPPMKPAHRGTFWEVSPIENGVEQRLGPLFGIREYACVVIVGIDDVRTVARRWIDGTPLRELVDGVTYWDRRAPAAPLAVVPPPESRTAAPRET